MKKTFLPLLLLSGLILSAQEQEQEQEQEQQQEQQAAKQAAC